MIWRNKLEQLVGMLEKIPQPQSFASKSGVYEPYFIIELRASNWEIVPYASYTRLDNSPGREVRLTLSVVDSSKVDITQNELDALIYLEADSAANSRSIFSYTQPVGFLMDWLSESRIVVKESAFKEPVKVSIHPEVATIILQLKKGRSGYYLQPSLVFSDQSVMELNDPAVVLCSNPIYMLVKNKIYKISSALPAVLWHNYFRIREKFEIPHAELGEFIRLYVPHLLPVLDWENLGEHIQKKPVALGQKLIYLSEWNQHLQVDVRYQYGAFEFPAYPEVKRSLANEGRNLFIIERNRREECESRKILEDNGLIYRGGTWSIAADYNSLDWMRLVIPKLEKAGFTIVNEEKLVRYRVHRQRPRLQIKVKSGIDWLDLNYQLSIGKEIIEIPDLLKQIESERHYLRLADGSNIYLPEDMVEKIRRFDQFLELKKGHGNERLPMAGIALLNELSEITEHIRYDRTAGELLEQYRAFREIQRVEPPQGLTGNLREYQRHGLDWLMFLNDFGFGGILADDMGLGKTVQVISMLLLLKERGALKRPALIVVPLTLIFNWWEELAKFAPGLTVLRYYGNRNERGKYLKKVGQYDVVLCSYGVALQDQKALGGIRFNHIILDESQKIKNPNTKTYKAITRFQSRYKLAMTGTPVENSLIDLWAQINFTNPGLLGTLKQFQTRYIEIPEEEQKTQFASLRQMIFPFILRRTKEEVETELPPLTEIVQYIEMSDKQRESYQKSLEFYRNEIFSGIESDGINKTRIKIVEALTYLRQIACHPAILDENIPLEESGKVQLLEDMLGELLDKGHKVLIFSQFVRFLSLVRKVFDQNNWRYEYLDGKVRDRAARIHNFQQNPDISAFLIS
ncbi:MAG: SNF2 helicase associated domain-containing protein, partial [Calditrichaeota bacterium]|nr:SNF2 helicase associated domain-containing protein [Calditrichota bacterium]